MENLSYSILADMSAICKEISQLEAAGLIKDIANVLIEDRELFDRFDGNPQGLYEDSECFAYTNFQPG